jgi:Ni/Fe-hydrogenase subunit HybB-like protein
MSVRSRLTAFRLAWLDSPGVRSRLAGFRLTWWDMLLLAVAAAAVVLALIRYATGIASVANINNAYPWGWWVGYGIMTLIAVGGVGFTITLLVEVLGFHRYHPLLRPAVLMAFLCYTSAIVTLMVELGRPWMVWMILVSWAPTAALYEVGWCAFLYLTVLAIEFAQVPAEELGWGPVLRVIKMIYFPVMLLGVTLSHLHQSSLGTLMVLIPHKINVLWWSENLPLLFLFSAMMAGPALAILEHLAAARWLGFAPRLDMLGRLARIEAWIVALFLAFQLADLFYRGATDALVSGGWFAVSFWLEVGLGLLLPLVLLMLPEVRGSAAGLGTACTLIVAGVLLHRLNVAVIGLRVRHWETYFPALAEVGITLGITAGAVFVYGALIRILPIHEELAAPHAAPRRAAAPAGVVHGAGPATVP